VKRLGGVLRSGWQPQGLLFEGLHDLAVGGLQKSSQHALAAVEVVFALENLRQAAIAPVLPLLEIHNEAAAR